MRRALEPTGHDDGPGGEIGHVPWGSAERLRRLVEEHLDFVARSVRRMGVPATDLEDAVQKVFLTAGRRLADVAPGSERSFLFGVATRVASHERRAQMRRGRVQTAVGAEPPDLQRTPESLVAEAQRRVVLDEVMDGLPDELRAVFILFELEELSLTEIGRFLELPRGTVASRLRRARELFAQACERVRRGQVGNGGTS